MLASVPRPGLSVVASTLALGWKNVQAIVVEGRLTDVYRHSAPDPVVAFLLSGTTLVEWQRGRRFTRFSCAPGSLTIVPAGGVNDFRTDRPSRWLVWGLEDQRLQAVADQEWNQDTARVEVREAFNNRDAELWTLGQRLAAQLSVPRPGARLYAESLDTQIAIQLLWNHSTLARRGANDSERLGDARLRRVVDFIHVSLGNEISLGELADLAGLSPNYFLSAFKQATGKTPHRYLTEKRIEKACELLQNPHCTVVDVSLAVGFSSQSHLTTVFRRFMKTTPAAYRDEVLGLRTPDSSARRLVFRRFRKKARGS
jgi:AraC family transcriptional regulator